MAINKFKFKRGDDTEVNVDIDVNSYPKLSYTMSVRNINSLSRQIRFRYCGGLYDGANPSVPGGTLCGVFETPYIDLESYTLAAYSITANKPIMIYDSKYKTQYCLLTDEIYDIPARQPYEDDRRFVITSCEDDVQINIY